MTVISSWKTEWECWRLLASEVEEALKGYSDDGQNRTVSIATGRLPYPYIKKYAGWINEKFPGRTIFIFIP